MRLLSLLLLTFACAHQPAPQARRSQMEFEPDPVVRSAARIEDVLRGLNTIGEAPS